jgi:hypothetical protein
VIEGIKSLNRGLVHIAVKPENRNFAYLCGGQRILEPSLQKNNSIIEQAVPSYN